MNPLANESLEEHKAKRRHTDETAKMLHETSVLYGSGACIAVDGDNIWMKTPDGWTLHYDPEARKLWF